MQPIGERPRPGRAEALAPGVLRVLAPNPSPMTHWGTNSYILGDSSVAVIDPGPDDILVTHTHVDHSALAPALARATGAPVCAFGDALAGRSARMADLARAGGLAGGEGIDRGFAPDLALPDGAVIEGEGWTLRVLHTPGHIGNHLCFLWEDAAFSGDHVMGWASTMVSPPDGDLTDFMASLDRLAATGAARLLPGHGDVVAEAPARIAELAAHRRAREAQILACLPATGAGLSAAQIVPLVYAETPPALHGAAARNVLAHLIDLSARSLTSPDRPPGPDTRFRRTP